MISSMQPVFFRVFKERDFVAAAQYLDSGVPPGAIDSSGVPALVIASGLGALEVVKNILEKGGDPNVSDLDGITPLHAAAMAHKLYHVKYDGFDLDNRSQIIEELLVRGADPNATDKEGRQVYHHASWLEPRALRLLAQHNGDYDSKDPSGRTPLSILAGIPEQEERMRVLIVLGANINSLDSANWSPLMYALAYLNTDYSSTTISNAWLLIQKGFDVKPKSSREVKSNEESHWFSFPPRTTALMVAADGANTAIELKLVERLIELGAEVDLRNQDDRNAFDYLDDSFVGDHSAFAKLHELLSPKMPE